MIIAIISVRKNIRRSRRIGYGSPYIGVLRCGASEISHAVVLNITKRYCHLDEAVNPAAFGTRARV